MEKRILVTILLVAVSLSCFGASEIDRKADFARKKEGKLITCSPKQVAGTLTLDEALQELKPGDVLRILPGRYALKNRHDHRGIKLEQDNIIIEGDGSGNACQLSIDLRGKNCIIRSIYLAGHLEAEGVTIVDSRINPMICNSDNYSKTYIYNCLITGMQLYPNNADIELKNCTLVHMYEPPRQVTVTRQAQWKVGGGGGGGTHTYTAGGFGSIINLGQMAGKGSVKLSNCIVYTNGYLYYNHWTIKSLRAIFKDNVIYCGQGILRSHYNQSKEVADNKSKKSKKDKGKSAKEVSNASNTPKGFSDMDRSVTDFKDLDRQCSVSSEGKNYFEKIQFSTKASTNLHNARSTAFIPVETSLPEKLKDPVGAYIGGNGLPTKRPEENAK